MTGIAFRRGYTLVEVLIGISIVGVLFSLGYANYRDFSRRQTLAGAARIIKGDLRLAQVYAVAGKKPATPVCASPNLLDGYNFSITGATTYEIQAGCSGGAAFAVKSVSLADNPVTSGITLGPGPYPITITFKALGQGIASGANTNIVVTLTSTSATQTILVTSGGEIQ